MADIESVSQDVTEIKDDIKRMFQPNGICDNRHKEAIDRIATLEGITKTFANQQKVVFGLLMLLAGSIVKMAFFGG